MYLMCVCYTNHTHHIQCSYHKIRTPLDQLSDPVQITIGTVILLTDMLEVDENTPMGMAEVCIAVKGQPPPESFSKRVELTYEDRAAVGEILLVM